MPKRCDTCIIISAGAEWRALLPHYPQAEVQPFLYGDGFATTINHQHIVFLHGGWGKVAAAGSTQFAIDRWLPSRIVNIGTCGGFSGHVTHGEVVLAAKTIIYDIVDQMTGFEQAIAHYTVDHDLTWVPESPPQPVIRGTLLSADRDLHHKDIPGLTRKYHAIVADWESGAIAWVARKNNLPCLILRAVSDLVTNQVGEAYENYAFFERECIPIMAEFAAHLPAWLAAFKYAALPLM